MARRRTALITALACLSASGAARAQTGGSGPFDWTPSYGDQCLAILPQSDEIMAYGGSGLFCLQQPDHSLSLALREVAQAVAALRS